MASKKAWQKPKTHGTTHKEWRIWSISPGKNGKKYEKMGKMGKLQEF
jgi:hypothetical protein